MDLLDYAAAAWGGWMFGFSESIDGFLPREQGFRVMDLFPYVLIAYPLYHSNGSPYVIAAAAAGFLVGREQL